MGLSHMLIFWIDIFFELFVRLNPEFNCCSSFAVGFYFESKLQLVEINFCTCYCKFCFFICSSIRYYDTFLDQTNIRLISQLIKDISMFLQKLLRYFNGTIISTFSVPFLFVLPVIFGLNLSNLLLLAPVKPSIALLTVKDG